MIWLVYILWLHF